MTQLEGQRSVWEPSGGEILAIYKDPSHDASATVATKKVDGTKNTFYMIAFNHGNRSFSLEPGTTFEVNRFLDKNKEDVYEGDSNHFNNINNYYNNLKSKLLSIDGEIHSLVETPKRKSEKKISFDRDRFADKIKKTTMRKRSVEIPAKKRLMTVEIFTIIDYSLFNKFFKESKASSDSEKREDARTTIRYLLTHIMEEVKNNYEAIEIEGLNFTTKWVGALIAENANELGFFDNEKTKINSDTYEVNSFMTHLKEWDRNEKTKQSSSLELPNYDYLAVFTSHRLFNSFTNHFLAGKASGFEICTVSSFGIVEYVDARATISTASHELAHVLGVHHDGLSNNCSSNDNFIMTEAFVKYSKHNFHNAYLFSPCSHSYLIKTINRLDSIKKNCLAEGEQDFDYGRERNIFLHLYPGQIYDLDEQCRMTHGPNSYYCSGVQNDKEMCQIIRCYDGVQCNSSGLMLNAMDGTPCSKGAWCFRGKCTLDSRVPRTPEGCPYGDRNRQIRERNCKSLIFSLAPVVCEAYKQDCCASCTGRRNRTRVCQDVIDECSILEPKDCYNDYYATTCCETCTSLVQNPLDDKCLYGDKSAGCSDLVPEVCHLSTRYCCHTCATYRSSV